MESYKERYLKYKIKYLNLKNLEDNSIGGAKQKFRCVNPNTNIITDMCKVSHDGTYDDISKCAESCLPKYYNQLKEYMEEIDKQMNKQMNKELKKKLQGTSVLLCSSQPQPKYNMICSSSKDINEIKVNCHNYGLPNITLNFDTDIIIAYIPKDTFLYKAMTLPTHEDIDDLRNKLDQRNILNRFANQPSWFSNEKAATGYAEEEWAKKLNYKVVQFKVTKDIKLFYLYSTYNLKLLKKSIETKINNIDDKSTATSDPNTKIYFTNEKYRLKSQLEILQLTTGIDVTFSKQIELCRKWGNILTNDPKYNVNTEIDDRINKYWKCTDVNNMYYANEKNEPSVINFNNLCTVGPREEDITRISFTTDIDKNMVNTIYEYFNVDGYTTPPIPTVFHRDNLFAEELALVSPRDVLEVDCVLGINCNTPQ